MFSSDSYLYSCMHSYKVIVYMYTHIFRVVNYSGFHSIMTYHEKHRNNLYYKCLTGPHGGEPQLGCMMKPRQPTPLDWKTRGLSVRVWGLGLRVR